MSFPTPDSEGFVTVQWPSKTVPHGGIMHPRISEPTPERQKFLKELLDESKFSIELRNKNTYNFREPDKKEEPQQYYPMVRPRTSKRRSLSAIRAVTALDDYVYKPMKRGEDREKLKDKLAKIMAFGDEKGDPTTSAPTQVPKKPAELPTAKEQWHDLLSQIRERAEWLAEMEALGCAADHRDVIEVQIAERIRAMKALGVESQCSSVRSGFSTTRSREPIACRSNRSRNSTGTPTPKPVLTGRSSRSQEVKDKPKEGSARSNTSQGRGREIKGNEENVTEYQKLSPSLQTRNLRKC